MPSPPPPGRGGGGGGGSGGGGPAPPPPPRTLRQATLPFSGGGSGGAGPKHKKPAAARTGGRPSPAAASSTLHPPPGRLDLGGGAHVTYLPAAIPDADGAILAALQSEVAWLQRDVTVWGRTVPQRRLVAYQGDTAAGGGGGSPGGGGGGGGAPPYTYSGLTLAPEAWTPAVAAVKAAVEAAAGCAFDTCLLNLYRDGHDAMAWHADGDALYGPPPVTIASASFGAARAFQLRPTPGGRAAAAVGRSPDAAPPPPPASRLEYALGGGDVLIMGGTCQRDWQHSVPPRARVDGVRINLTFRATAAFKERQKGRRV